MINPTLQKAGFHAVVYSHMPIRKNGAHASTLTTIYAVNSKGETLKVSEEHPPDQGTNAKKRLHKQLCLSK